MRTVSLIRAGRAALLAAAGLNLVALAGAQEARPDVSDEMKQELRQAFAYAPAAGAPAPAKAYDVILMRPVVVRSRFEAEGLDAAIAHQEAINDRFTLYKGGVIAGPIGVWYQDDPTPAGRPIRGLNFFKVSW